MDGTLARVRSTCQGNRLIYGMKLQHIGKCSTKRKALNRKGGRCPYYMTSPIAWFVLII